MATGTDEPMDDEHRKILRRCKGTLVKDMEPRQVLLQMEDPLLFTTEEENQIMSRVTRQLQCDALLDMLPRKGAKAYDIFKKTIAIVQPHLTRTIIEAENTILRSELRIERAKSADLRRRLIHRTVKDGNPTDDELEKLGSDIGEIWVKLGRRLDVSDAKLKEIDKAHSLLSEKGYHALREWEHKKGAVGATYQALCDALQHDLIQRQDLADKFCYIKVMDTGTRSLTMGRPEPSRPVQAEQGSFTEVDTGTRPLAVERVEPSGPIPAENLETSDSQIMDSVERNQACLQCTKLAEELNDLKTQIERLHQQQLTHEEVNKYKNAVSRAFLPSEKDFPSPTGVLSSLIRDSSVKPVATRSSEGPGEASDIFDQSEAKESGTDEKMNSWW